MRSLVCKLFLCGLVNLGCGGSPCNPSTCGVSFVSPASPAYVRDALVVQASARGTPKQVELLDNGSLLAVLQPPAFGFSWSVNALPDGTHQLVLRATYDAAVVTSDPVVVNVDHTPPSILNRTPAPGATDVSPTAATVVAFSEPIVPGPLSSALAVHDDHGTPLKGTVTISSDGQTLTFSPEGQTTGRMKVVLSPAIADRAGNVAGDITWEFRSPFWVAQSALGTSTSSVEADILVYNGEASFLGVHQLDRTKYFKRKADTWEVDSTWEGPFQLFTPSAALDDSGRLIVAGTYGGGVNKDLVVRYPDKTFETVYQTPGAGLHTIDSVRIRRSANDRSLAVGFVSNLTGRVYFRRPDTAMWIATPALNHSPSWIDFDLQLSSGTIAVAYQNQGALYVETINGYLSFQSGFSWVASSPGNGERVSLRLNHLREPVVATTSGSTVMVSKLSGSAWVTVGRISATGPATSPKLALTSTGDAFVSWQTEQTPSLARVSTNGIEMLEAPDGILALEFDSQGRLNVVTQASSGAIQFQQSARRF